MEGISYQSSLFAAGTGCVYCVWRLWEWYRARSSGLKDIPGPDPESRSLGQFPPRLPHMVGYSPTAFPFMSGNMRQLFQSEVGEMDFQWQEQYGGIMRIKGPFGVRFRRYLTDRYTDTNPTCGRVIVGGPFVGGRHQGCASYPPGIQLGAGSRPEGNRTVAQRSRNSVGRWYSPFELIKTNGMQMECQVKPTNAKGKSYNPPSELARRKLCCLSSEAASNASVACFHFSVLGTY